MRTRERDEEFRDFYFRETARLRYIALLMTGDQSRAEDLAHDALLRAYRAWGRIRSDDPGPYVRSALANLCRTDHRRRALDFRKRNEVIAAAGPQTSSDRTANIDEGLRIAKALEVLSPIRKATIVLHFYEDLTEAEVARILDRPLNTVKSDVRRGLQQLRESLMESHKEATGA